jgi:hypothetical protein
LKPEQRVVLHIFIVQISIVMKTKKIEKYSAEYWRELDKEQRMTDKLDREHYERRINSLLDLANRGKGTPDYDPNLVKSAARAWMYLNRNRDSLLLTNYYKWKHYDEETGELIVEDSGHVKSVKRFRIILEGCLMALGLPTRIAHEANI